MEDIDPSSLPSEQAAARATLVHNERTKLSATLLNGVALAFVVGGGVATFTSLGGLPDQNDPLLRALVWIVTGAIVHAIARRSLGSLQ